MRKRFLIQFVLDVGEVDDGYDASDALDYVRRCLMGKEWLLLDDDVYNAAAFELTTEQAFSSVHIHNLKRDLQIEYERESAKN